MTDPNPAEDEASHSSASPDAYDVIVVGYGRVGALNALLLAESGLRVAIYDSSSEPVVLPRAVGLDGESVRTFQRISRADEIEALLQPPREKDLLAFTDSKHEPYFEVGIPERGPNGWRETAFFDQPELEALLRRFVDAQDGIDVFLGHEVVALGQDERRAWIDVDEKASEKTYRFHADYVIGADGASSFVRRTLGIEWTSLGYDQDWLVIDITIQDPADLPLMTMQVCDPARLTTYVCVKDPNRRWEFQLVEGETREEMVEPARIEALLADWIAPDRYAIRRAAVYQFHAATASQWRAGRFLLAGDAAHQTPPFLGQGLNAGFRDAVNLGWKLPLVLSGRCDAKLLDSYFDERDAHATDLVDWAVGIGKLMETLAAQEAGRPNPHPAASQSDGYGQGRTVPPLRDGVLRTDQADGIPIGFLIRQHRLRHPDGSEGLFDDLLGRGFAIVGRTHADLEISPESRAYLENLDYSLVALEDHEPFANELDQVFESTRAVVLRPDRILFGITTEETSLDDLMASLAEKLHLI